MGNVPVYVRRKAFAVFCILVTCGAECFCSVFCPMFEEAAQRDGMWTKPLILPRLLPSDLFRPNVLNKGLG